MLTGPQWPLLALGQLLVPLLVFCCRPQSRCLFPVSPHPPAPGQGFFWLPVGIPAPGRHKHAAFLPFPRDFLLVAQEPVQ